MKAEGEPGGGSSRTLVLPDFTSSPLFRTIEIVGAREGGIVSCHVPIGLIDHEEVPVKDEWVDGLAKDMRADAQKHGGTGQLTPTSLGVLPKQKKLKIVDGFHRDAALLRNGEISSYSEIMEMDWDGLFDKRIFTAKDHAHVRFSRVVQWIEEVWGYSGLSEKLSVQQAVLLHQFGTSGVRLGLKEDEVEAAKAWVATKETQWQINAMTIRNYLIIAETVDPSLVHSAREKKGGRSLEAPTQAILKIFSDVIPNNFDLQNIVMQAAMAHNLKGPYVKALCQRVKDCKNQAEAVRVISQINWEEWEPSYSDTTTKALRRAYDPRHKGELVLASAGKDVQKIIERVDLSFERGEEITPEMRGKIAAARDRAVALTVDLGRLSSKLNRLMEKDEQGEQLSDSHQESSDQIDETVEERPKTNLELFVTSLISREGETVIEKDIREKRTRALSDNIKNIGRRMISKGETATYQAQIDALPANSPIRFNLPRLAKQTGLSEIKVFIALRETEAASRR